MMNKSELFQVMGLGPVWELRKPTPQPQNTQVAAMPLVESETFFEDTSTTQIPVTLESLAQTVRACQSCGLCQTRTQTVFADGTPHAPLMVVGEAPGADEDAQGFPFVGKAGQLLDKMLASIQHSRSSNVYIANVLKCRPPNNRNPEPQEVEQCWPFLKQQIEINQPKVLFLVGRFAINAILQTDLPISQLRGQVHSVQVGNTQLPAIVSYHPAYLLRRPEEKAKAWEDLLLVKKALA
jgi:uracil-DNA glycosylase family 4